MSKLTVSTCITYCKQQLMRHSCECKDQSSTSLRNVPIMQRRHLQAHQSVKYYCNTMLKTKSVELRVLIFTFDSAQQTLCPEANTVRVPLKKIVAHKCHYKSWQF